MPSMQSRQASSRPKAVVFDMGGVVIPSPVPLFKEYEEKHGLNPNEITSLLLNGKGSGMQLYISSLFFRN